MPEAISRSSVSQIASYGPPEELSSQAPKAEVKAPAQSNAESMPLEKADKKQMSYEKCIAQHEKASFQRGIDNYKAGGCFTSGYLAALAATPLGPAGTVGGAVLGCLAGVQAGEGAGTAPLLATGNMEGRIACDDLPKKQ